MIPTSQQRMSKKIAQLTKACPDGSLRALVPPLALAQSQQPHVRLRARRPARATRVRVLAVLRGVACTRVSRRCRAAAAGDCWHPAVRRQHAAVGGSPLQQRAALRAARPQVIYQLNTKSEDLEFDIAEQAEHFETEIEQARALRNRCPALLAAMRRSGAREPDGVGCVVRRCCATRQSA